jgi:conjugative relaxase-like TrwC/TraI family protein
MLRIVSHQSAAAAQQYYGQGLRREDYYSEGQEIIGKWYGQGAKRLGLSGDVTPDAFEALIQNRHPSTGERLTPRTKVDRRVGYDFNFHAPKSLSILHALTGDKQLLEAFRSSVAETMQAMETLAAVRVRKGGADGERVTGNLVWAEFVHLTARPVGGLPDPHLHVHAFTFNSSFDEVENRWKAGQFHDLKQRAPLFEAEFHSRLSGKIASLGYPVERTKAGWEVGGIPRTLIEKFSRRSAQIDRLAEEKGIKNPKAKDGLGASSREGKRYGMTDEELRASWKARMSEEEKEAVNQAHAKKGEGGPKPPKSITPAMAADYALEKLFEKNSVVECDRLVATALKYGVGQVTPDAAQKAFEGRGLIVRKIDGVMQCTSAEVLAEEVALINFVRAGRGAKAPLAVRNFKVENDFLSAEQKAAVQHLLNSRDQVTGIRGGAGVGKTTLMREAVAAIEARGIKVFAFAPSASASRGTLRESGFENANTVASLLASKQLQKQTKGQVIWIDEAGLVGVRDLWKIMQVAGSETRVILTGDTAQHAPVARGDAFRLLQRFAGMKVAQVTQIRRQEKEDYREAVDAMSKADLKTAFRRLDALGAIVEIGDEAERYAQLAADYVELGRKGPTPLVVSPTHAESAKVTTAIRSAKLEAGQLGPEKLFRQLHNLQWEDADRKHPDNFYNGLVVQFHQNDAGIKRGEQLKVIGLSEAGEVRAVGAGGKEKTLPLKNADRFQVFEEREIPLAKGDKVRITRNGETGDGRRISNGDEFTIDKIDKKGNLVLTTGGILKADHGHLTHGYCQTSHSSQSKSVRDVLIAQSSDSFVAASREQFYVSISRGKETVRIYTDSRQGLETAVGYSSTRKAGIELAGINREELAAFMSGEMNGKQWRDAVASRRGPDGSNGFVDNLMRARREEGKVKDGAMDWQQYVAARRANVTADGRNRSKGHPSGTGQKKHGDVQNKYRSFLRPTEHSKAVKEQIAKADPKKPANDNVPRKDRPKPTLVKTPKSESRTERIAKAFESAAKHFKKVVNRQRDSGSKKPDAPAKAMGKEDVQRAAKHSLRQKKASAQKTSQQTKKQKQIVKTTPTPRKGK